MGGPKTGGAGGGGGGGALRAGARSLDARRFGIGLATGTSWPGAGTSRSGTLHFRLHCQITDDCV